MVFNILSGRRGGGYRVRAVLCAPIEVSWRVAGVAGGEHQVEVGQLVVPGHVQQEQLDMAVEVGIPRQLPHHKKIPVYALQQAENLSMLGLEPPRLATEEAKLPPPPPPGT